VGRVLNRASLTKLQEYRVLLEIEKFAQNGTSRNKASAFLLAGLDAGKIQEHQQKLQQCLSRFGVSVKKKWTRHIAGG